MSEPFDEFFDDERDLMAAGGTGARGFDGEASSRTEVAAQAAPDARSQVDGAGADGKLSVEASAEAVEGGADAAEAAFDKADAADCAESSGQPVATPAGDQRVAQTGERHEGSSRATPSTGRQAPPFWMVLAIAGISLVLGMVIGYLMGTSMTIAELESNAEQAAASGSESGSSVGMPEGHPEVSVDEDGNATVVEGGEGDGEPKSEEDVLARANGYFDMGMAAMESAQDEQSRQQAAALFTQAVALYDEYLQTTPSASAEVDRAICLFYAGSHDEAIASLEDLVEREAGFAPAWANLGMFYEAHGEIAQAKKAYQEAIDAASKDDTYGVGGYAQQRLDALNE